LRTSNRHLLATESPYKINLFTRLGVPFHAIAAHLDESPLAHEDAESTARRLALAKASHLQSSHPQDWIWGSDQVCLGPNGPLGKPGDPERAIAILQTLSGQQALFLTAVALVGPNGYQRIHCEQVTVQFRSLSKPEIERYIAIERPLDTAGAFKVECLGISLFDSVTSRDPTALEGLPLITISQWCRDLGLEVP
jgi:septum formation protein